MEWSHSRINLYRTCPYAWFAQYILREDSFSNFFSEYGTFIHDLLAQFYKNEITRDEMIMLYITQFKTEVASRVRAKTFDSMREKYYDAGLDYIQTFEPFKFSKILGVEKNDPVDGSQVADLWKAGDFAKVADHCKSDVAATRACHRKLSFMGAA